VGGKRVWCYEGIGLRAGNDICVELSDPSVSESEAALDALDSSNSFPLDEEEE